MKSEEGMEIIAIVGPTAVGKTALAIKLAKELDGEIISCDSMQIYKGMDIGTAKPTREELASVKHHLIDIKEPWEEFSCADYAILARECIEDIISRGKTPIFCGGTGLYLDSVIEIGSFSSGFKDENYRRELETMAEENGAEYVHAMLKEVDEKSASEIHPNNVKRVIRALEIYHCTGIAKSVWDEKSKEQRPPYEATVLFLTCKDREVLKNRIDLRVDMMINEGLLEEARRLYDSGMLKEEYTSYGAIGYKELLPYFSGEDSLENCVEILKTSTRQYAKRQITWFSRKKNYKTLYVDEVCAFDEAMKILEARNEGANN